MSVSALDTQVLAQGWQDQQAASADVTQTYELREERKPEEVAEEEKDSSESA